MNKRCLCLLEAGGAYFYFVAKIRIIQPCS